MKRRWVLGILGIAVLAVALVIVGGRGAWADVAAAPGVESVRAPAATLVVTSTADSGPGTLRQALLDAGNGDTITFDSAVFPPGSPVTITLTSGLPDIIQGNLTIDASNAGVILDGSSIGVTPETMLLDDVSLTLDDGPNLTTNGDFTAGTGHWRPWDDGSGATRGLNSTDFTSPPNAYEWITVAHAGDGRTVYDTTDTSDPLDSWPYNSDSTVWMPATGGSTAEAHLWYKGGGIGITFYALLSDGGMHWINNWWFDWAADWTEAVAGEILPADAIGVALELNYSHPDRWTNCIWINSNGNIIQGLQIVNFPGDGIGLDGGAQYNTIGGDPGVGAGPMGQGNLLSGNSGHGVGIYGSTTKYNAVSGNYIGTDVSGTSAMGNKISGVYIANGQSNVIGGSSAVARNVISGNRRWGVLLTGPDTMNNVVSGNFIGTNVSGDAALSNGEDGVRLDNGAQNNVIGGTTDGQRNVISGNAYRGIFFGDADDNVIIGNYIGTDASGTVAIGNLQGLHIFNSSDSNVIGGTTPMERNLISGNGSAGLMISGSTWNRIQGNFIGLDATGNSPLGNIQDGVHIFDGLLDGDATLNTIGGIVAGERNFISGNGGYGISISGSGTVSNSVSGNYIGTNVSGTVAISNAGAGVSIGGEASYNLIGGDTAGERNLISGNGGSGVQVYGSSTMSNTISGNFIGTDASGTSVLGNIWGGVAIEDGAQYNTIGGDRTVGNGPLGEGNLISGNSTEHCGVCISSAGTDHNRVSGNYIGTDISGTVAKGNGDEGVWIWNGARHNIIGGPTEGERNLISGNGGVGVRLSDTGTVSNTVSGNYIGTDASGAMAIGNHFGVALGEGAQYNVIGGSTAAQRNIISGNAERGVSIDGANIMSNTVSGNYIGLNTSGTAAVPNGTEGVIIINGATHNTIGGSNSSQANVISGNNWTGVRIEGGGTMHNTVSSNYIGLSPAGTAAIPNGSNGVDIIDGATHNLIGGDTATERNIISGNNDGGVLIRGSGSSSNIVRGNFIGTDVTGTSRLPNGASGKGVFVFDGATDNVIGGPSPNEGNLISGNDYAGVEINGAGTTGNVVQGNYIGTDVTGAVALGNWEKGVFIFNGAQYNRIGGTTAGERNVISGNDGNGVQIEGSDTNHNVVTGNYIGTDANGTATLPNGSSGVSVNDGASFNTIGGSTASERNLISSNNGNGVDIRDNGTMTNTVSGNYIGTDVSGSQPLPNDLTGVYVGDGASHNTVGDSNTIAFNGGDGVQVQGNSSLGNTITHNSIYSNTEQGIYLGDGGNTELAAPVITGFDLGAGIVTGTACANWSRSFPTAATKERSTKARPQPMALATLRSTRALPSPAPT
jgi:parallel beta-helix repeat protein